MSFTGVARDDVPQLSIGEVGAGRISTMLKAVGHISLQIAPASVPAASAAEQSYPLQGLVVGDVVSVTPPGNTAGVVLVAARVATPNVLAITFVNPTAGALVPLTGLYQVLVVR